MSNFDNTRPAYRVLSAAGFFGPDDNLYEVDSEIYFDGEPNEEMEPLNEPARLRLSAYLEKLDDLAREVAIKTGRPYVGRPRSLDGGLTLATAVQRSSMQIMGDKTKDTSTQIEKVDLSDAVPELPVKRPRGRPKVVGNRPEALAS